MPNRDIELNELKEILESELGEAIMPIQVGNDSERLVWQYIRPWLLSRLANDRGHLFDTTPPSETDKQIGEPAFYIWFDEVNDEINMYFYTGNAGDDWEQISQGVSLDQIRSVVADLPKEPLIEPIQSYTFVLGFETTLNWQYEQGHPLRQRFRMRFFASFNDRENDNDLPISQTPSNISFDPPFPVLRAGTHAVSVSFVPRHTGRTIAELYLE